MYVSKPDISIYLSKCKMIAHDATIWQLLMNLRLGIVDNIFQIIITLSTIFFKLYESQELIKYDNSVTANVSWRVPRPKMTHA